MEDSPLMSNSDITRDGIQCDMVDNIRFRPNTAIVVNTDVSSGSGIHYIVLIPIEHTVYIIDPLGSRNISQRPYDSIMFKAIKDAGYDYTFYPGKFQFNDSHLCGYFSTLVAKRLNELHSKTPQTIWDTVEHMFGMTADTGDIRKLMEAYGTRGNSLNTTLLKQK